MNNVKLVDYLLQKISYLEDSNKKMKDEFDSLISNNRQEIDSMLDDMYNEYCGESNMLQSNNGEKIYE